MDPDQHSPRRKRDSLSHPRPSSSSTHIEVGTHSPSEEELYEAAAAMREAMRNMAKPTTRTKSSSPTTHRSPPQPPPSFASASSASVAHATVPTGTSSTPSSSSDGDGDSTHSSEHPDITTTTATTQTAQPAAAASDDNPLAFEADMARYPPSMTSSVREHVFEGGLRYHAYRAGKYAFPNDEVEQNRDDMKHAMTLMLCRGEYFYAPVKQVLERGGEVLDLGTGTGIWAMELGDKYPNTTFTGIDLSPIQPNFVPENVHFFVDDFEEEWVDPEDKYDFIHLRYTLHSVQDPKALLARVLRHLKPGGYFEAHEIRYTPLSDDDTLTPTTPYALRDYMHYIALGLQALGSDAHAVLTLPATLEEAGFADVRRTTHKLPLGVWPRDRRLRLCGLFLRTAIMDGLRGVSRRPLAALGWTPLQVEIFLVEVRKAVMDERVHAYFEWNAVYGRKPES